jgi:Antitoxin MazE-like
VGLRAERGTPFGGHPQPVVLKRVTAAKNWSARQDLSFSLDSSDMPELHVTRSLRMPNVTRSSSRDKARATRERMKKKGMRLVQFRMPDIRSKAFKRRAHLDSLALATSPQASEDQDFVDAVSVWKS